MFGKNRVHRLAQLADPFAVYDSHLRNAASQTFREVIRHDALDIRRTERMQIQHAIDGKVDRLHAAVVRVRAFAHARDFSL